jgi:hypothetical protein
MRGGEGVRHNVRHFNHLRLQRKVIPYRIPFMRSVSAAGGGPLERRPSSQAHCAVRFSNEH